MEYFASGKYHEALLLFKKLDAEYELNPRFKAYIGVCYYYEWDYEQAAAYIDAVIDQLDIYAPHERSFYYFADAESHFQMGHYRECIPLYERQLQVCYDNEKGDSYYRVGFSRMFLEEWEDALVAFEHALDSYRRFRNTPEQQARITQIEKMITGIREKIEANKPAEPEKPVETVETEAEKLAEVKTPTDEDEAQDILAPSIFVKTDGEEAGKRP